MVKCSDYEVEKYSPFDSRVQKVTAHLISDTADEVKAMGNIANGIEGLPNGTIMLFGSDCFTMKQELLQLNSQGIWE